MVRSDFDSKASSNASTLLGEPQAPILSSISGQFFRSLQHDRDNTIILLFSFFDYPFI